MAKILLLSDYTRGPERDMIMGLSKYGENLGGWTFYQGPFHLCKDRANTGLILSVADDLEVDAIFGQWPEVDVNLVAQFGKPVFLRRTNEMEPGITNVYSDHKAVGEIAAKYFKDIGFVNFAFSGYPGKMWVVDREASFRAATGEMYRGQIQIEDEMMDWQRISLWLKSLPKPVGILACNDMNARTIISICRSIGLDVPSEVAVLGVDNDSFTCQITSPLLSSISLDYEQFGYRLGKILDKVLNGEMTVPPEIINIPLGIVERQSTRSTVKDPYVRSVIEFMKSNFQDGIGIDEAVADIPLSRRSIEKRFKKEFGNKTMLGFLTELKLGRMKELLCSSDAPVYDVAFQAGFSRNENIFRLFKSEVGCTPSEFRRRAGR